MSLNEASDCLIPIKQRIMRIFYLLFLWSWMVSECVKQSKHCDMSASSHHLSQMVVYMLGQSQREDSPALVHFAAHRIKHKEESCQIGSCMPSEKEF